MINSNSPDGFMFRTFEIHSQIFHQNNKNDYFMISSGTNQFPFTSMWKETLTKEIEFDFLYRWYTGCDGFQCITSGIKIYEDFLSGGFNSKFKLSERQVCMATGGSGAASLTFNYLKATFKECSVFLLGYSYSLYERLAKKNQFQVIQILNRKNSYLLPTSTDISNINYKIKPVFILSYPCNPTGEVYSIKELADILKYIKKINGFLIIDKVCKIDVTVASIPDLEYLITKEQMWESCAVINSFSKSDSTAGLRIGYIYGNTNLIRFCSSENAASIMNPPTFPALSIVLTCLFRCIYISKMKNMDKQVIHHFIGLYKKMFYITSSIIPSSFEKYVSMVFDHIDEYYDSYIEESLNNEQISLRNYYATLECFQDMIKTHTTPQNGFNFCVEFSKEWKYDELTLIKNLIEKTGVAILTESSFSTEKRTDNKYFIRFSTACDEGLYYQALYRMKAFIEKEGFKL